MAAFTPTGVEAKGAVVSQQLDTAVAIIPGQAVDRSAVIVDPQDSGKRDILGVAISTTTAGIKSVSIVTSGKLLTTNAMTINETVVAAIAGQLKYESDLVSGDGYIRVGYTEDANTLVIDVKDTGWEVV